MGNSVDLSGWGMVPPRQRTPLEIDASFTTTGSWKQGPQTLAQLASVIPDVSDDEASRHGSIVELEIYLRKASIVQSQTGSCDGLKIDAGLLVTEESDVLGPLHSPLTSLTPSIRTSASPRASSECLGSRSPHEDQPVSTAVTPKRPRLDHRGVFKHAFSFGQSSKARKESGTGPDPKSMEDGIQRPSSARTSLGSSVLHETAQDVMLVNPITGERKMSSIRSSSAGGQLARPNPLRRSSSATSMFTLVRRDSLVGGRHPASLHEILRYDRPPTTGLHNPHTIYTLGLPSPVPIPAVILQRQLHHDNCLVLQMPVYKDDVKYANHVFFYMVANDVNFLKSIIHDFRDNIRRGGCEA
ncbi:hypothetical protein E4T45_04532 [Aureobasidium sp. EXF-8846]|nr:hypothetical protein E4T45_04532 [Aureobasidium sp. EXF-8846]